MAGIGNINVLLYVRFCKLCYEEGVSVSWKVNTMLFNALLEKGMADESLRPKPSKTKRGRKTYTQKFRELKIKDYRLGDDDSDLDHNLEDEKMIFSDD